MPASPLTAPAIEIGDGFASAGDAVSGAGAGGAGSWAAIADDGAGAGADVFPDPQPVDAAITASKVAAQSRDVRIRRNAVQSLRPRWGV